MPILAALALSACSTVPQTGRSALRLVGEGEETRMGISAFEEMKKKQKVSADAGAIAMVQRVGQRIAAVANPDIPNANWEFVLFEDSEPNAFALPGGKVGVHTGILPITKTDAGLAAVLGHEIGHVAAHHGAERMSQQMAAGILGAGVSIGLGVSGQSRNVQQAASIAFGVGVPLAYILPHSRLQESEADRIGLTYMAKAGYDPKEAIAFWERFRDFNAKKGGRPPEFLSTHPADERRISDLKLKWLPEAEVYYQTSGK